MKSFNIRFVEISWLIQTSLYAYELKRYKKPYLCHPEHLPKELKVTAISDDDVIMGIEHQTLPIAAVQFHPESIMTLAGEVGLEIIKNVVSAYTKTVESLVIGRGV